MVVKSQVSRKEDQEYLDRWGERLSETTTRARWIGSPDEHEEHPGQSLATRSHEVITRWAEERGAKPAAIAGTEHDGRPGVLRFDFPGYQEGRDLTEVGWDKWFESFDKRDLVFVFQEHLKNGNQSNFFKFDSPHREQG